MTTMIERPPPEDTGARAPDPRAGVVALLDRAPGDVDGVLAQLADLQELLEREWGRDDGLACFNRLYLRVVRGVAEQLDGDLVDDPELLARVLVELARRYVAAVRADADGLTPPWSWAVLLCRRADARVDPVGFAVAGVNAHVNYDLAPALVRTCTVLGRAAPGTDERLGTGVLTAQFARHLARLCEDDGNGSPRPADPVLLDRLLGEVGGVPVVLARETAWRQALELWERRSKPAEYEIECEALDRRTALTGRGLLTIAGLW